MSKRTRSSVQREGPNNERSSTRLRTTQGEVPTEALNLSSFSKANILTNVAKVIERAPRGVWLRLMPLQEDLDSLFYAVDFSWEDMLPALHHTGLVAFAKRTGKTSIQIDTWTSLESHFNERLQFSQCRIGKSTTQHPFLCLGTPQYKSFVEQAKSKMEIPEFHSFGTDASLRRYFRDVKIDLLRQEIRALLEDEPPTSNSNERPREPEQSQVAAVPITPGVPAEQIATIRAQTPLQVSAPQTASREQSHVTPARIPGPRSESHVTPDPSLIINLEQWEEKIGFALVLDLERKPRLNRMGTKEITVHGGKQADAHARLLALATAKKWGWQNKMFSNAERQRIAQAACTQVSYDLGYSKRISWSRLEAWEKATDEYVAEGDTSKLAPQHKGAKSYIDRIEADHPGYVRELFRYSQVAKGYQASFEDLANCMCEKSDAPGEDRPTLTLHPLQVYRWFKKQNGKEKSPNEKPRLTDKHKTDRILWAKKWFEYLKEHLPFAFLDEKWFYTDSRRRTIKFLPPTEEEKTADPSLSFPRRKKVVSRRYCEKVMFLGVVACPRPEHEFDGRVFLKRVAKEKVLTRASPHQRFTDDAILNTEIKNGGWRNMFVDGMTTGELLDVIVDVNGLEDDVAERLELRYEDWSGQDGNKTWKSVAKEKELSDCKMRTGRVGTDKREVTIYDVELRVVSKAGDTAVEDVSCDSEFMLAIMDELGTAVRTKFSWISDDEIIYLVMDNAGGHGTVEAIETYTKHLMDKYNIQIVHQVPRSPETNLLDLGIWRSVQSAVEKEHLYRCHDADALARTVQKAWDERLRSTVFANVYKRLLRVLKLIIDDNGDNNMVESERGKLFSDPVLALPADPDEADPAAAEDDDVIDDGWI